MHTSSQQNTYQNQDKLHVDARQVVANPEQYRTRPLLRRLAWAALMQQRGHRVDQARLAEMPVET